MTKPKFFRLEALLKAIALTFALVIFLKAIIDFDTNYDVGWYHLPFAARIWGIVPAESFSPENLIEHRFDGFPLLAHFFQGLLWKVTGRIQATSLVGYFSLIIYFALLRRFFQVPLYLSVIAIFAIPAVLTHAATSFVDLPGNIGVSVLMMMLYSWWRQSRLPNQKELWAGFLGAAMAANTKPQLQPLIFLLYWIVIGRLVWLYWRHTKPHQRKLWRILPIGLIASALIFATPLKNVALYGNPFYPIKIEVAGIVLNHKLTPDTYSEGNRPQKWLQSVLEISTPPWSADQWNFGKEEHLDRGGGFYGAYVVFNFLLLLGLTWRERWLNHQANTPQSRHALTALLMITLVSLVPANFPQSHELRYFMFWMITLVSCNLILVTNQPTPRIKWLHPKYLALIALGFLLTIRLRIGPYYFQPVGNSWQQFKNDTLKAELVQQMKPNTRNCLIARHAVADLQKVPYASMPNSFFYSAYFHPEVDHDYNIKISINPKGCGELPIVPSNVADFDFVKQKS